MATSCLDLNEIELITISIVDLLLQLWYLFWSFILLFVKILLVLPPWPLQYFHFVSIYLFHLKELSWDLLWNRNTISICKWFSQTLPLISFKAYITTVMLFSFFFLRSLLCHDKLRICQKGFNMMQIPWFRMLPSGIFAKMKLFKVLFMFKRRRVVSSEVEDWNLARNILSLFCIRFFTRELMRFIELSRLFLRDSLAHFILYV